MKPWDFYSTTDKILRVLIEHKDDSYQDMMNAVHQAFPALPSASIDSSISQLSSQKLISVLYADNRIYSLQVQPYALAHLLDKKELKVFYLKWDLLKIFLGYVLGFLSSVLFHLWE